MATISRMGLAVVVLLQHGLMQSVIVRSIHAQSADFHDMIAKEWSLLDEVFDFSCLTTY